MKPIEYKSLSYEDKLNSKHTHEAACLPCAKDCNPEIPEVFSNHECLSGAVALLPSACGITCICPTKDQYMFELYPHLYLHSFGYSLCVCNNHHRAFHDNVNCFGVLGHPWSLGHPGTQVSTLLLGVDTTHELVN